MNGTDALLALTRAFEDAGLPYMIVGSYSSNFYGIPRSTKDADLVVNLDTRTVEVEGKHVQIDSRHHPRACGDCYGNGKTYVRWGPHVRGSEPKSR